MTSHNNAFHKALGVHIYNHWTFVFIGITRQYYDKNNRLTSVLFSRSIDDIDSELVWKFVLAISDAARGFAITFEK